MKLPIYITIEIEADFPPTHGSEARAALETAESDILTYTKEYLKDRKWVWDNPQSRKGQN